MKVQADVVRPFRELIPIIEEDRWFAYNIPHIFECENPTEEEKRRKDYLLNLGLLPEKEWCKVFIDIIPEEDIEDYYSRSSVEIIKRNSLYTDVEYITEKSLERYVKKKYGDNAELVWFMFLFDEKEGHSIVLRIERNGKVYENKVSWDNEDIHEKKKSYIFPVYHVHTDVLITVDDTLYRIVRDGGLYVIAYSEQDTFHDEECNTSDCLLYMRS